MELTKKHDYRAAPLVVKLLGLVAFSILLLASSCRKKGDNERIEGENKTAKELIPTTTGSWWLIRASDSTVSITTPSGRDTFLAGNVYDYFEMKDTITGDITPYFYAKDEKEQYYLSLIDLTDKGDYVPVIICTVDPVKGDSWTNTSQIHYSGIAVNVKTEGKVVETDGTLTLNGHVYHDVIKTENKLKAKPSISPAWINSGMVEMYFVEGVGVIKQDLDVNVAGFFKKDMANHVLDYHIEE